MDSSHSKTTRLAVLLCCLAIAGVSAQIAWDFASFYQRPLGQRFSLLWTRDTDLLTANHIFPAGISDLQSYEITAATERMESWKTDLHIPFKTSPKGHFHLEILLLSWEEKTQEGAIVQYNLVDLRTKDMVWELGRTFILHGQNPLEEAIASGILSLFNPH